MSSKDIISSSPKRYSTYKPLPLIKTRRAKLLVWHDLSVDSCELLNESTREDSIKILLADLFTLDSDDPRDRIVLDLYFYIIRFAQEQNFANDKTSVFFSIMKETFEAITESPFGSVDDTFKYFKDLLVCHSVNRPPWSLGLFSHREVRHISEYGVNTLFRHFKMYKYAFTPRPELDLVISYVGGEVKAAPDDAAKDDDAVVSQRGVEELPRKSKSDDHEDHVNTFKAFVREFLEEEVKKIEGSLENQLKSAIDVLQHKIEPHFIMDGKRHKSEHGNKLKKPAKTGVT